MATVISIVLILAALFMIVTVLLQSSQEGGISAIRVRGSFPGDADHQIIPEC